MIVTELAKRQLEVEAALKEKRAMEQRVRDLEVQDQCFFLLLFGCTGFIVVFSSQLNGRPH